MNRQKFVFAMLAGMLLALGGGYFLGGKGRSGQAEQAASSGPVESARTTWTCSMHPQIKQPNPGDCPLCGMDLIPLVEGAGGDLGPRELTLSETARHLAEIETAPVRRQVVERELRMVGTIAYDETQLATITAWVGGRLDRLYVDYTGVEVRKGDHMVWMYSPDVLVAQEELLQAKAALAKMAGSSLQLVRDSARATLAASRDKLLLWGLSAEQVAAVEASGEASDHIQINAPVGGVVIHKSATEGMYVKTGTPIYQIANLSQVWAQLDAYESDLAWLRYGQDVAFTSEAYPGEVFHGRISFIAPVLTAKTRTVKVRVNVPNGDRKLKPGMFVRAVVRSLVASGGKVVDANLAGKWVSPMHPEVVSDEPGDCTVCGMALVKAEELGFVSAAEAAPDAPLVIPASAPLLTGKRAVVYVQAPDDPSRFAGRTVVLGPRAGDFYTVASGLEEGELVVTHGNFKLDSALQIVAKPSMMSAEDPAEEAGERYEAPAAFRAQLGPLFEGYLAAQTALAGDDLHAAQSAMTALSETLASVDMSLVEGDAHLAWMKQAAALRKAGAGIGGATDIEAARGLFDTLSQQMIEVGESFGTGLDGPVNVVRCTMAFDNQGADWLQYGAEIANPYFGASMLRCGSVTETLSPAASSAAPPISPPAAPGHHHH